MARYCCVTESETEATEEPTPAPTYATFVPTGKAFPSGKPYPSGGNGGSEEPDSTVTLESTTIKTTTHYVANPTDSAAYPSVKVPYGTGYSSAVKPAPSGYPVGGGDYTGEYVSPTVPAPVAVESEIVTAGAGRAVVAWGLPAALAAVLFAL